MDCRQVQERWELYHDSEGDSQLYLQVNEHLADCPACSKWFDDQRQFELSLAEKLRAGQSTDRLWFAIHNELKVKRLAAWQRFGLLAPQFAVAASLLLIVAGWRLFSATDSDRADLAQLISACHERLVGGREQLQFVSDSDLEVESYLKKRVNFPVRCPPRQDAGFEVRGGGVCKVGESPAAYVHGLVGSDKVSVFILPRERLAEFPADQAALQHTEVIHRRAGSLETVMAAIDQNIVLVVGQENPERLERVVRAYGTYPEADANDSAVNLLPGGATQASVLAALLCTGLNSPSPADPITKHFPEAANSGCMNCHTGIELIREPDSEMMQQIMARGRELGDPAGCVVCHGGNPNEPDDKIAAHGGKDRQHFFSAPGSSWINDQTCGQCHQKHVDVQWTSLMMTEAGKIQGVCWTFGSMTGYKHLWANYAVKNPEDPADRLGTDSYREYMERLKKIEPNVFVDEHEPLPEALKADELHRLHDDTTLAAFTYIRQECQRCHHAVKGRSERGDYRGIGCSSCHTPYGNEGFYEGNDPTIDKKARGHMLVHSIQGTRQAKVTVHDTTYSGIPVETCTTCHDRGKRIGVSFQGLMESPYASPFAADGGPQPALHTKHYIAMEQDVHYLKGMTCQDCHTSVDVHGDGFLAAANLASVQIECADCHGTPDKYPWELPLGYMDEFAMQPATGHARGVAREQLDHVKQGHVHDPRDGYLLTARGNPYENVVRDGEEVIVHTAAGKDIRMQPLKKLFEEDKISERGKVAMKGVATHLNRMECYTCHTSWTPQCYGCHVKIDYSQKDKCPECNLSLQGFDWVAAGRKHQEADHAADRGESGYETIIPGKVTEERSYTRWEEPMLGINGEGRVTPLAPGCQPSVTIIGEDGKPILLNHIYRTDPGLEQGGDGGQLAIDMSPTQPHTTTKNVRSCESCHASQKALGLGIPGTRPWDKQHTVELETVDGRILPEQHQPQMEPVENLNHDWSQIVDSNGNQVATVGHHFQLSRAFNKEEQQRISREGTCLACHQEIPSGSLAVSFLHHVAQYTGQLPETADQHSSLLHKIVLMSAWLQLVAAVTLPLFTIVAIVWWRRRKKRKLLSSPK